MKFSRAKIIPLVMKLGDYLKKGFDHYVQMKQADVELDPDLIAAFITIQMESWNPELNGKSVLDPDTKEACARFLGGLAFNLAK